MIIIQLIDGSNPMRKSRQKPAGKALKPGQAAPASGVLSRPRATGEDAAANRGKPLPPMPKAAANYTLRAKSGRYIITSPARSANTVDAWSRAFNKK